MDSIWGNRRKIAARLTMLLLLALALAACGGNDTVKTPAGNKPPVVAFTLTPAEGAAPLEVSVDAGGSTDPDGHITDYAWEFGDGATATGVTASHTYSVPGKHTVTLTVTDDKGASDQRQATVTVTAPPANQAPTAAFSVMPETGAAPLEVELDASASSDPDGNITSYAWNFGDGEKGDGVAVSHTYGEPGEYTITLTVTDDKGATAERTATVTVTADGEENQAPLADFSFTPAGGEAPLEVEFSAAASYDPDGTIVQYAWEFGDGASGTSGSSSITRHTYLEAGDYTVTLTVTDDRGATGQRTRQVKVLPPRGENQPPIAAFNISPEAGGEVPLTVEVDASPSRDSDGWINQYAWDFGGGASASGRSASHTFTTPGEHTITLTVTDNEGGSASSSQSVTVLEPTPKNQPPVASFTLTPDSGIVPLEVAFDASSSSDPDGSITSYEWDFGDGATGEGVSVTHTYKAAGEYTVTLTVTDDAGDKANRHTTISVDPAPGETTVDPVFKLGIVAGGDITTYMRGEAAMSFLAGGNLEAMRLTLSSGHTARAAGTACQLQDGPCDTGIDLPAVPAPDFSSLRAAVVENVLATYGAVDLAEVCDHYVGEGPSRVSADGRVVCLAPSQGLEIREDVTDLIIIGDETTEVRFLRGTVGGEAETVVIVSGIILAAYGPIFIGDVSLITAQAMKRLGATFLSSSSGARPLIASEGDITINQIGETHALVWTGGAFTTAGDRSEFIGTAVVVGDYLGQGSADMTYAMPDTVENPYLPRVPAY